MASLTDDLSVMREAACEAGNLALDCKRRGCTGAWEKAPGHPVTEADLAVNGFLARKLGEARRDYGWLSEETADDLTNRRRQRVWVVDPIDGTRAFMKGRPDWCIGLALVEDGKPVLGVVYAPELDRFYEAQRGAGAWLNGVMMTVSQAQGIEDCRMIAPANLVGHPDWPEPWPTMDLMRPGPNATLLRLALVASGEGDAMMALARKADWDVAAGALLVEEAGGHATTHTGAALAFNRNVPAQTSVVAAGNALHRLLVRRTSMVRLPDPNAGHVCAAKDVEADEMGETKTRTKQLLHLVIGGELKDVTGIEFEDLDQVEFVGAFPSYEAAYDAWKAAAQRTVDNAEMRFFILHAHRLLDPHTGAQHSV